MRVLITGSRQRIDYHFIKEKMIEHIQDEKEVVIIHGGAKGVDSIANKIAIELGYKTEVYLPKYNSFGVRAPLIRNEQMINSKPDIVLAFPNSSEEGGGTWHTIRLAQKKRIRTFIY